MFSFKNVFLGIVAISVTTLMPIKGAYAQSSGVSALGSTATISSLEQINSVSTSLAALPNPGIYSEGKLRFIDHDGYEASPNYGAISSFSMKGTEVSGYAGGIYNLGGNQEAGFWQIGGFAGYTDISLDFGPRKDGTAANRAQVADASHNAFLIGGLINYRKNTSYLNMALALAPGSNEIVFRDVEGNFDSLGVLASLKVGNIINLSQDPNGMKLDLRFGAGFVDYQGKSFQYFGEMWQSDSNAAQASITATFYKDIQYQNGILKPYFMTELKQLLTFENNLTIGPDTYQFTQDKTSLLGELGIGYFDGKNFYTGGVFGDKASDRFSWGGKVKASFMLN